MFLSCFSYTIEWYAPYYIIMKALWNNYVSETDKIVQISLQALLFRILNLKFKTLVT